MAKVSKKDIIKKVSIIGVFVAGLALITTAIVMLSNHQNEILARAEVEATNKTENCFDEVIKGIKTYELACQNVAGKVELCSDELEAINLVSNITKSDETLDDLDCYRVNYFRDNKMYSQNGHADVTETFNDDLALIYQQDKDSASTSYVGYTTITISEFGSEPDKRVAAYEFYAPVKSTYCDGLAFYFTTGNFQDIVGIPFDSETRFNTEAEFSCLVTTDGVIKVGGDELPSFDLFQYFETDKTNQDKIRTMMANKESGIITYKIGAVDYVLSVKCDKNFLKDLVIVELYNATNLGTQARDLIDTIIAVIILFVLIVVIAIAIFVYRYIKLRIKVTNSETTDLKLQCFNRHGFEKEAGQILMRQSSLYYGVVIVQLRHFKFLNETYGEQEVNSLLNYLRTSCQKTCRLEETYGHIENGEFLLLIHSTGREALIDRLKIHSFLASQYKGAHKFDISLKYGIYEHQADEKTSISKMIDYATEANNAIVKATVENVDMQFNFYDDNLRKIRLLNEDMELRQETALKEGEFQVFYQAKYNLKTRRQDGAEALVRWYDKKTGEYNKPALFMPLFESNGFIEKLDKYVYTKVCEYISYSLASGRNVFPVSVNVSRITATQPDFVEYYTTTKKKFGISNDAITIEFTESFAYENYDVLKDIVFRLHKNGFKVSIDDFGCGYSSYRILKELPMDEIKLDKFFIDYSEEPERVNFIFDSVISLAKNLKMKVTQEGVEKPEDVELLKQHGCDVIQGYIYSHPLSLTDYLYFVENTKDHVL